MDTNAIHKIELEGDTRRDVVTLEWHPYGKIGPLVRHENPCPSRRRRVADLAGVSRKLWLHGERDVAMYPHEKELFRAGFGKEWRAATDE